MIKRIARWILRREIAFQLKMSVPIGTVLEYDGVLVGILSKDGEVITPAARDSFIEDWVKITGAN